MPITVLAIARQADTWQADPWQTNTGKTGKVYASLNATLWATAGAAIATRSFLPTALLAAIALFRTLLAGKAAAGLVALGLCSRGFHGVFKTFHRLFQRFFLAEVGKGLTGAVAFAHTSALAEDRLTAVAGVTTLAGSTVQYAAVTTRLRATLAAVIAALGTRGLLGLALGAAAAGVCGLLLTLVPLGPLRGIRGLPGLSRLSLAGGRLAGALRGLAG